MAIIVELPIQRRASSDPAEREGGATILFFTGVRYEREIEVMADLPVEGSLSTAIIEDTGEVRAAG